MKTGLVSFALIVLQKINFQCAKRKPLINEYVFITQLPTFFIVENMNVTKYAAIHCLHDF